MKQHLKSLGLTLVIASLFFGFLIGTHFYYKNIYLEERYQEKFLEIAGVEKINIQGNMIIITLANVPNLKKSYQEIIHVIEEDKYQIEIVDLPSQNLENLSMVAEIALEEGMMQGNFREIDAYILNLAANQDIVAKIFIDQKRFYLHLQEGDNYLYRILERPSSLFPLTSI